MTRKSFTTLSVEVKVPQAPGYSQKEILNWIKASMEQLGSPFQSYTNQIQVKLTGKKTTYL
jgi:hypothetical protein